MDPSPVVALKAHFAHLKDPRVERTWLHQLLDMVIITICAVIAGAESWDDIALVWGDKIRLVCDVSGLAQWHSLP